MLGAAESEDPSTCIIIFELSQLTRGFNYTGVPSNLKIPPVYALPAPPLAGPPSIVPGMTCTFKTFLYCDFISGGKIVHVFYAYARNI